MEHRLQKDIEIENYIPLRVICQRLSEPLTYVTFSADGHSVLDIGIGRKSRVVSEVTLVLCRNYSLHNSPMPLPSARRSIDEYHFSEEARQLCSLFDIDVYSDGIQITFSKEETEAYYAAGRVCFGCNSQLKVTVIYLSDLCSAEIEHFMDEVRHANGSAKRSIWKRRLEQGLKTVRRIIRFL